MQSAWKEYVRDCLEFKVAPVYSTFTHHFTKLSLWIHGFHDSSHLPLQRNLAENQDPSHTQHRNLFLCNTHQELPLHNSALPCKHSITAFVASKTMHPRKGVWPHDILKRNLVEPGVDTLITIYVKCGALAKAKELLGMHKSRNVSSWTAVIAGYAHQGRGWDALDCFEQMQCVGVWPDAVTFACVLKACGTVGAAEKGEQIHNEIARQGLLEHDYLLGTALVHMYAKCGALTKAQQVLEELPSRNVITWSALITGYAQQGQGEQALACFEQMQQEGLTPNEVTFISILKACASVGATDKGEQIHDEILRQGLLQNNLVLGTALVGMYAKCGALGKAQQLFEELPSRNVVTWSTMIAAYAQQGRDEQALNCYEQMQNEGFFPSAVTFACSLKACGGLGAIDKGEQIHDEISRQGLLENDAVLGTALVDMYAKCGKLAKARQVVEEIPSRSVSIWNALIAGYAQQSQGKEVLSCFECMQREGLFPNVVTFTCVLNVCSQLGLVEDCYAYFLEMRSKYDLKPELEHYTCMVGLLGRAGLLDRAVRVIQEMPSYDSAILASLLGACQKWGHVTAGKWAFERALQVDRIDAGIYVLMANIYAAAGMHEDTVNMLATAKNGKLSRDGV